MVAGVPPLPPLDPATRATLLKQADDLLALALQEGAAAVEGINQSVQHLQRAAEALAMAKMAVSTVQAVPKG